MLAIVPARKGSKSIHRKNLAMVGGKPMLQWTLDAIEQSKYITDAILTSDDDEMLNMAHGKTGSWARPAELATDDASTESVIKEVFDCIGTPDWENTYLREHQEIVLLQPTSPIRTAEHIDDAIYHFREREADCLVSVCDSHHLMWVDELKDDPAIFPYPLFSIYRRPRRQDLNQCTENGAIYIFTLEHWRKHENRLGGKTALFIMDEESSIEVDSEFDLWVADQAMKRRLACLTDA